MGATYRMRWRLAASDPRLSRWGPWQDSEALLRQVPEVQGGVVSVVGDVRSGGMAALVAGAREVRADLASAEGASLALSVAACRELPRASAAALFGEDAFGRRVWFYHQVRGGLPSEARVFWDARERLVREGLCDAGRFEQRLRRGQAVWRLGTGTVRAAVQARFVAGAWGRGARIPAGSLLSSSRWWTALSNGRADGLTAAQHAAARSGEVGGEPGRADVVWLGDALDGELASSWKDDTDVAVGWTVRRELPAPPDGWSIHAVEVPDDSPLARSGFTLRRG